MTPTEKVALEGYLEFVLNTLLEQVEQQVNPDFVPELWSLGESLMVDWERTLQTAVELSTAEINHRLTQQQEKRNKK